MAQVPDHHGRFTEQVDGWFWLKVTSDLLNILPTSALGNQARGKELLASKKNPKALRNTNRAQTPSDTIIPQLITTPKQSVHFQLQPREFKMKIWYIKPTPPFFLILPKPGRNPPSPILYLHRSDS